MSVFYNNVIWQNGNNGTPIQFTSGQPYSYGGANAVNNTPLPRFISAATAADAPFNAADYDYHLQANSPLIDAGSDANATGSDLDGNTRILGARVDIGAYEYGSVATVSAQNGNTKLLKIIPNPITNFCTLDVTALENVNTLHITNTDGSLLFSKNIQNNPNPQVDLSAFANGIYFLQVVTDTYTITQKIAVAR